MHRTAKWREINKTKGNSKIKRSITLLSIYNIFLHSCLNLSVFYWNCGLISLKIENNWFQQMTFWKTNTILWTKVQTRICSISYAWDHLKFLLHLTFYKNTLTFQHRCANTSMTTSSWNILRRTCRSLLLNLNLFYIVIMFSIKPHMVANNPY